MSLWVIPCDSNANSNCDFSVLLRNLYVNSTPLSVCIFCILNGNASFSNSKNRTEFSGVCSSKPYTNLIRVHSSIAVHWYRCFPSRFAAPFKQLYGTSFTSICTFSPGVVSSGYRLLGVRFFFFLASPPNPIRFPALYIPPKLRSYP
jgi:hypothetical protein